MAFFSVVIPAYNRETTIKRALDSVLKQSCTDYEVIVVDDCSKDNTVKAVYEYPNVQCHVLQSNQGACAARNKGINLAEGEYVAFLDSDDEWTEDHLLDIRTAIEAEHRQIVCTGGKIVKTAGEPKELYPDTDGGDIYHKELFGDVLMPTSCVAVSKKALKEVQGFDIHLPARQDYDLWLRITEKYQLSVVKKCSAVIYWDNHLHIGSSYMNYIKGTTQVVEKLTQNERISCRDKKKLSAVHYFNMAKVFANNKAFEDAKIYCRKSMEFNVMNKNVLLSVLLLFPSLYTLIREKKELRL